MYVLILFCVAKSLGYEKYFIKIVILIVFSKLVLQVDLNLILVGEAPITAVPKDKLF